MQNITYKYNKLFGNTKAVPCHMEAGRAPGAKMIDRQRHMQTACSPLAARGFCNLLCIRKMTVRHDIPHIYQNIKHLGDCPAVPAMQDNHTTHYQPSSYTERSKQKVRRGQRNRDEKQGRGLKIRKIIGRFALVWHKGTVTLALKPELWTYQ